MDARKLLIFLSVYNFFPDGFTDVLTFIDRFHYFSLLLFNDGGKKQFSVMVAKLKSFSPYIVLITFNPNEEMIHIHTPRGYL